MSPIVLPKEHFGAMFGGRILAHTLVVKDGKFLLLQRTKEGQSGTRAGQWDLPGGKANAAESPQAAARRATKGETGLDVQVREPLNIITRTESKIALEPAVIMVFRAVPDSPAEVSLSTEHKAYRWVTIKEAVGLPLASYIPGAVEAAESQGLL